MPALQTATDTPLFQLERGRWYGFTMYPGYGETMRPYHSPVIVYKAEARGDTIELTFGNLGYAGGGASMTYELKIMIHRTDYLIAEVVGNDRSVVLLPFSDEWLRRHHPHIFKLYERHRHEGGSPDERLNRVAAESHGY